MRRVHSIPEVHGRRKSIDTTWCRIAGIPLNACYASLSTPTQRDSPNFAEIWLIYLRSES